MSDLYLRQLLSGRDFAKGNPAAASMRNFAYAIGSRERRECVLVDPAWDVAGLLAAVRADDMEVTGALATHWHPDHVGGDLFGHEVEGIQEFVDQAKARVWVQSSEKEWLRRATGIEGCDLVIVNPGDRLAIGGVEITFLHTPGHTPGSQCFLVGDDVLVSGDTLFLSGCGRTDLPGGDPEALYFSLTQKLAKLPPSTRLYPGHGYDPEESATLGVVREQNPYLRVPSLEAWLDLMA